MLEAHYINLFLSMRYILIMLSVTNFIYVHITYYIMNISTS